MSTEMVSDVYKMNIAHSAALSAKIHKKTTMKEARKSSMSTGGPSELRKTRENNNNNKKMLLVFPKSCFKR